MLKSAYKSLSMVLCFTIAFMAIIQAVPTQPARAAGQTVTMDKPAFVQGQPITLSFTGASLKDWIGLYPKGAVPQGSNPSLTWDHTSAASQPDGKLTFTKALVPGEYEALYMQNDGYNIFQRVPFSVIKLSAPGSITFVDTDSDPNEVAGDVKIKNPADTSNILNYMLYWGNDVGKLSGQPAIATVPLTVSGVTYATYATYTFPANTPIPNGATKLLAYSNSIAGLSTGVETAIPGLSVKKPAVSFEVITDMHITSNKSHVHNKNIEDALKDMIALNPDSDGLMITGDNTEGGGEAEYAELGRIFNLFKNDLPPTYFIQGNHDVRWGDWTKFSELFTKYTNMKSNYYDVWIKGYHFIFLGTEKGLKDYSYLSETQLKWLDAKLSENESKDKPVFIFHHQPLKNTVAGANDGYLKANYWYGVRQDTELKKILTKHPQSIMFSGHTHWELGAKDTMYNAKYATMFNAGATSYLWTDANTSKDGSQGYFVEVYDDKVLVKGRDFRNDGWIGNAQFEVKLPAQIPVIDPANDPDLTLSNPTIKMVKGTYAPADAVQVAYTSSVREDWIGIFPTGTVLNKSAKAIAKQKTNSVKQPDGTMTFAGLNLAPGKYDAIYVGEAEYRTDNDNLELGRATFEVAERLEAPQAIAFTDTDKKAGKIGGDVTVTQATYEANIEQYVLYWGNDSGKLAGQAPIATIAKTGGAVSYTIPSGTKIPASATKLLAYSAGKGIESATYAEVAIADTIVEPKHPFVVTNAALATNTAMVDATVTVKPNAGPNKAIVVFQLMKGNTPISIASYEAQVSAEGSTFNAKFNVNRNKGGYRVHVLVVSDFSADLTNAGTLLAEPVTLK
ncbi:Calcineurin-like phosphoesterase [Paenibacillus tianmuensis]|uniref:Calcineurin-like phosphoesterase n=1 Tax=Paenibacillus tianmuensis TaxID=624147 RepID=A0A1G4TL66_9BACL|nr:metallophosphoesterase [Paenibacillus tianmuensis]SCW82170.1 Calcineurin-like phosphoesterase [Paenibacillus tianmuensis]